MAEAGDERLVVVGDVDGAAVGVVGDRHAHDLAGGLGGAVLVELHVHRARDLGLGRGRDELRVEALRERPERLHDALHVDDHGLDGAGEHGQLLVQEVAGRRDAVAHEDLVAGAADAGEVDALGAGGLGLGDELGVAGGLHEHRRERGLVAVHDDVDLVVLEHAEVDLADESGDGVPKRMSLMSVLSMAPPQPSAREQRRALLRMFSASRSTPSWVRCSTSMTSRSMARGVSPSSRQRAWRFGVARLV